MLIMFFEIDVKSWTDARAQVRGLDRRKTWDGYAHDERFWSLAFFLAAVERVDMNLDRDAEGSLPIADGLPILAARLRIDDSLPGHRFRRSLICWSWAIRGSAWRAAEYFEEAEEAFGKAEKLSSDVLPWAKAEVIRRHAGLLIYRRDPRAFQMLNEALQLYGDSKCSRAETFVFLGVAERYLNGNCGAAVLYYGKALDALGPPAWDREERVWTITIQNCGIALAKNTTTPPEVLGQVVALFLAARKRLSKNAGARRMMISWVLGLLYLRLGKLARAEWSLDASFEWFLKKENLHSALLVAVDLISCLEFKGDKDRARRVIDKTCTAFERLKARVLLTYLQNWTAAEPEQRALIRQEIVLARLAKGRAIS